MAWARHGAAGSFFELRPNVRDRVGGEPAPVAQRPAPTPRRPRRKKPRRRRGLVGTLIYWAAVLGVWLALAVGALAVWQAARLPPLHTLVVPKRPPTVTILGVDGRTIATRGDMGGVALPLKALPPYLPQAFVAIENPRVYGVEAAAQRYFGKSARAVTLAEATMLAGLVKAPSRLAPTRNPALARE